MHIISQKALKVFARRHPDSQAALDAWYQLVNANILKVW
jgi:mRNA-degrading endonuclease HigB of HigAB toxin-antitoxin module